MQGWAIKDSNLATCLGLEIGGWVAHERAGFEWVSWALIIFGSGVLLLIGMALPETTRSVMGNGSVEVADWGRKWWSILNGRRKGGSFRKDGGNRSGRDGQEKDTNTGGTLTHARELGWRTSGLVSGSSSGEIRRSSCECPLHHTQSGTAFRRRSSGSIKTYMASTSCRSVSLIFLAPQA